jgi:hypothetical protein
LAVVVDVDTDEANAGVEPSGEGEFVAVHWNDRKCRTVKPSIDA